MSINHMLQTSPVSQFRRRALLNDLYVNVVPKVINLLEFLETAACDADKSARVVEIVRYRAQAAAAPGSALAMASIAVMPVVVHCGNLTEVCSAIASL